MTDSFRTENECRVAVDER